MTGTLVVSRDYGGQCSLLDGSDGGLGEADPETGSFAVGLGEHPGPEDSSDRPWPAEGRAPRTLEQLIVDTWEGLVRGTSQCPVCGGRLEPQYGAHARPVAGHCADCDSTIS